MKALLTGREPVFNVGYPAGGSKTFNPEMNKIYLNKKAHYEVC